MPVYRSVAPERITFFSKAFPYFSEIFMYYFVFRGDKVKYLRWMGVRVGEGCQILNSISGGYGAEPWLIEIGNRVTVTNGVNFLTHDGASRLVRDQIPDGSRYGNWFGRILIHDECFIGINSIILPNVEIGPNSIVGVGSVVNKDVPPNMVYAGVPAKAISTLDEYMERYKQKMMPISANNRTEIREELTRYFWGESR